MARDARIGKRRKISGFFLSPPYHVQKWRVRQGVRSPAQALWSVRDQTVRYSELI